MCLRRGRGWRRGGGEASGPEPQRSELGGGDQLSAASLRAGAREILAGERALTLHSPVLVGKPMRRLRPGVRAKGAKPGRRHLPCPLGCTGDHTAPLNTHHRTRAVGRSKLGAL